MKILHIIPVLGSGGVERRRIQLARGMEKKQFEQRLIYTRGGSPLTDKLEGAGVRVDRVEGSWEFSDIKSIARIARIVRDWRPDIVHGAVFEGVTMAAIAGRVGGAEHIIVEEIDDPDGRSWRGNLLFSTLARTASACVGVSPAVVDYLRGRARLPDDLIVEVLNGVARRVPECPERVEAERRSLEIPDGAMVFGGIGRMKDSHKRYSDLIRAVAKLEATVPNAHVLLVGDGRDLVMLRELAEDLGVDDRVTFTGFRDDVGTMLELMDIFVLTSAREAFGLVLVEAMQAGLPVVSTRVGGPRRVVVEGETGLFVPPYEVDALARALEYLVDRPELRGAMGEAGRLRARREFSADRYVGDVEDLYLKVAGR